MLEPTDRVAGRLLVATPALTDENFATAVIYVLEHDVEGAAGVVLNRPSETGVAEVLGAWANLAAAPPAVFVGGPVRADGVVGVARVTGTSPYVRAVADGVGVVDLDADPLEVAPAITGLRLFAGYAGWGPGQLDMELAEGAWFVVDAHPDDVTVADPDQLWRDAVARQGGVWSVPVEDPSRN